MGFWGFGVIGEDFTESADFFQLTIVPLRSLHSLKEDE